MRRWGDKTFTPDCTPTTCKRFHSTRERKDKKRLNSSTTMYQLISWQRRLLTWTTTNNKSFLLNSGEPAGSHRVKGLKVVLRGGSMAKPLRLPPNSQRHIRASTIQCLLLLLLQRHTSAFWWAINTWQEYNCYYTLSLHCKLKFYCVISQSHYHCIRPFFVTVYD